MTQFGQYVNMNPNLTANSAGGVTYNLPPTYYDPAGNPISEQEYIAMLEPNAGVVQAPSTPAPALANPSNPPIDPTRAPIGAPQNLPGILSSNVLGLPPLPPMPVMPTRQTVTGNKRNSTLPPFPNTDISKGEMFMRMGGAMQGAAPKGGLSGGIAAATDAYGNIKDYNRGSALAQYEDAVAREQAMIEAEKAARQRQQKMSDDDLQFGRDIYKEQLKYRQEIQKEYAKLSLDQQSALAPVDDQIFKYQDALNGIEAAIANDVSLTGLSMNDIKSRVKGFVFGGPEQSLRLKLEGLRVDAILLNTAKTKGAISDSEMKIFATPLPSMDAQEGVWRDWIKDQQEATLRVRQRLLTGEVVPIDKRPSSQWDYMFKQEIPASKTAPDEESLVDTALKFMTD